MFGKTQLLFAGLGAAAGILWTVLGWARSPEGEVFKWKLFVKELVAHSVLGFLSGLVSDDWKAAVLGASVGEEALKLLPAYKKLGVA